MSRKSLTIGPVCRNAKFVVVVVYDKEDTAMTIQNTDGKNLTDSHALYNIYTLKEQSGEITYLVILYCTYIFPKTIILTFEDRRLPQAKIMLPRIVIDYA